MKRGELVNYIDVWETVFAMTSRLIGWYVYTGSSTGEGGEIGRRAMEGSKGSELPSLR